VLDAIDEHQDLVLAALNLVDCIADTAPPRVGPTSGLTADIFHRLRSPVDTATLTALLA
jgi:hypothetical protein